jgi:hypothetical protein
MDVAAGRRRVDPEDRRKDPVRRSSFRKDGGILCHHRQDNEFQRLAYFDTATMTPAYLTTDIHWNGRFCAPEDGGASLLTNEAGISKLYLLDTASKVQAADGSGG